jgi:hypothetical protein
MMPTKKIMFSLLSLLSCLFYTYTAIAQDHKGDKSYLQTVTKTTTAITKSYLKYATALSRNVKQKKELRLYKNLLATVKQARKEFDSIPAPKTDSIYKNGALSFTDAYLNMLDNNYKDLSVKKKATLSYDGMNALSKGKEKAAQQLEKANLQLHTILIKQDSSSVNKLNKLDKKVITVNTANTFFDLLYSSFFRTYLQETNVYNSIRKNNKKELVRYTDSLSNDAQLGLDIPDTLYAHKDIGSVPRLFKHTLKGYATEAKTKLPVVLNYFANKEELDLAIPKSRGNTKASFNEYAAIVKKFNAALKKYNKTMRGIYKSRKCIVKKWRL